MIVQHNIRSNRLRFQDGFIPGLRGYTSRWEEPTAVLGIPPSLSIDHFTIQGSPVTEERVFVAKVSLKVVEPYMTVNLLNVIVKKKFTNEAIGNKLMLL